MRKTLIAIASLALMVACGGKTQIAPTAPEMRTSADSMSYVMGMNIGRNLWQMDSTLNVEALAAGIRDHYARAERFTQAEAERIYLHYINVSKPEAVLAYEDRFLEEIVRDNRSYARSKSGLTYLRERGMDFSAWTVDDEATLRALLEMGITNITTRKPVLALRLRDEIQGTPASHGLLPLTRMEALIRSAGEIMRSVPDEVRNNPACKEGSANFVTAYDVKVQEFLKEGLSRQRPKMLL
mgnify:CR=1 FL=1